MNYYHLKQRRIPSLTSHMSRFPIDVRRSNEVQRKLLKAFEIASDPPHCEYRVIYVKSATQISRIAYEFEAVVEKKELLSCAPCMCQRSWYPFRDTRTTVENYYVLFVEDEHGLREPGVLIEAMN